MKFRRNIGIALASLLIAHPAFAGSYISNPTTPASLTRTFTSSTTDTVPSWATGAYVTLIGGGGSGALNNPAAGGASGQVIQDWFTPVTAGGSLTITVGAGGAEATTATGNAGGASSVSGAGSNVPNALGGGGANGNTVGTTGLFSFGGSISSTTLAWQGRTFVGQNGEGGGAAFTCFYDGSTYNTGMQGGGGCSPFGKSSQTATGPATDSAGYGVGGPGATTTHSGAGGPGLVIVHYVQ